MTTIQLQLPDTLKDYLDGRVARIGATPEEFLRSLIEADRARQIKQEIESQLLEAANGPFSEWNEADIGDIREAGLRLIDRRARQ